MDEETALVPGATVQTTAARNHGSKNMLGTLSGCYVPCTLNIMGIILFLRLAWAVGQVGILGMLGIIALAETMAVLTVLSLSALVSNGNMRGGGTYFLISRSLGPAAGGSIGVLFYFGYAMGVAFYTIGVATAIQTTWFPRCDADSGPSEQYCYPHDVAWLTTGIASACLILTLAISLAGAEFFARFNILFFAVQMVAIAAGVISFLYPHRFDSVFTGSGATYNTSSAWPSHFADNLFPDYSRDSSCDGRCSFAVVFAITFPMATGIMEGANLSGDLKDPGVSIPKGTLWAVFTAIATYTVLIFSFGGAFDRAVLQQDLTLFQAACLGSPYIVVVGIVISALSSALGSLFGASRLLQAIARDQLLPVVSVFGYGSKKGDEPRLAVLFTWVIAQAALFMGDIDVVAPVITAFFCLSYAVTNLTCFLLTVMGVPNFRPRWRYFSQYTALFGFIINVIIMFFLNWLYGLVGGLCLLLLYLYLAFFGPIKDWGDVSQELMFHQVRKYLLLIDETKQHAKFWKPNMIVIHQDMQPGLAAFTNSIKKGGLLVFAQVLHGHLNANKLQADHLRARLSAFIKANHLKAFPQVAVAPDVRVGYQVLVTCGGLGGMTFNTVVVTLPGTLLGPHREPHFEVAEALPVAASEKMARPLYMEEQNDEIEDNGEDAVAMAAAVPPLPPSSRLSAQDYCCIMHDALFLEKNVLVACNYGQGHQRKGKLYVSCYKRRNIDVWLLPPWKPSPGSEQRRRRHQQTGSQPADYGTGTAFLQDTPLLDSTGVVALLIQLGQTFKQGKLGPGRSSSDYNLRVMHVWQGFTGATTDMEAERQAMHAQLIYMASQARLEVQPENLRVILTSDIYHAQASYRTICSSQAAPGTDPLTALRPLDQLSLHEYVSVTQQLLLEHSSDSMQLFAPLPMPPSGEDSTAADLYLAALHIMTNDLPPTALVCPGQDVQFISTDI